MLANVKIWIADVQTFRWDGKCTASKRPLRMRYFEIYSKRTQALKREKQIKGYKSRKYIEALIESRTKELTNG